jgi:Carboxypeptidase regulatory-like domain
MLFFESRLKKLSFIFKNIEKMASLSFGCSQQDLYTGGRIVWSSLYADRWQDFADYSPIYTEKYGTARLPEIDAAERLPDKGSREAMATAVLRELGAANKEVMSCYVFFRSYVTSIYDASIHDLKMVAIGDGYYTKANGGSWGNTVALLGQAVPFLEDNLTELMSKNVIPTSFPAKMQAASKAFKDKYTQYIAVTKAVSNAADDKTDANNGVFEPIRALNKVAQIIYKDDQASAKLFVWSTIVDQTHGVRNAGVGGKMTEEGTKKALEGVKVTIKNMDKTAVTAKNGRYEISPLSSGTYIAVFEKEGYEPQTIEFKINTGVTARLNVVMKLVAVA